MSVDKLVDSTQLDADLTSVANAIRTKSGTSASLAFPSDFVSAIAAIPSGSDQSLFDFIDGTLTGVFKPDGLTAIRPGAFNRSTFTSLHFKDVDTIGNKIIEGSNLLTTIVFEKAVSLGTFTNGSKNQAFYGAGALTTADFYALPSSSSGNDFQNVRTFNTLVLRSPTVSPLLNVNCIADGTCFKSGGTGGTIYIPKALYDHLGDGTSNDYKAATNWATVDGYGTITWAAIEGSYYETHYADGTVISNNDSSLPSGWGDWENWGDFPSFEDPSDEP